MASLVEKFLRLKVAQPGNREKTGFEFSFGMPQEEQHYITPVSAHAVRILSQIEFAINLSKYADGQYDAQIEAAVDFLLSEMDALGSLTVPVAQKAEEMLLSLSVAAKEYTVLCAAHAHIDMNWMWAWNETVASTLDTFRTMLELMDEYPDFKFSQSQGSVYKIVEDFDPEMMERIKQRIKEGRWEITASTWVENDKNMPGTEALVRHNLYTKKYLQEHWDMDPDALLVDFSPDTFGHGRDLPEIIAASGVKYYYHCRAYDGPEYLYRWRSRSGQEVMVYREPYWYNSAILPHVGIGAPDICDSYGMKTAFIVYGVGDHGGGPTRRDIEQIIAMDQWPVFPNIRFGTYREFFETAEAVRDQLHVVDRELNYFAPGCYTTQSRVKLGNRKGEALLCDAETASALSHVLTGSKYYNTEFERAWQNVLFTHFHDILTGSCVQDSREHAMGLYQEAFAVANTQRSNAMRAIAANIDTSFIVEEGVIGRSQSEGAGVGHGVSDFRVPSGYRAAGLTHVFHVFNPSAHARKQVVELTVWDWQGDMARIEVVDAAGHVVGHQLLDNSYQNYWDHKYFRVLIDADLPALGYDTYILRQKAIEEYKNFRNPDRRSTYPYDENVVLENALVRAEFDSKNARLVSFIDKQSGCELVSGARPAGFRFIEEDPRQSSAWTIGRYINVSELQNDVRIQKKAVGADLLQQSIEFEQVIRGESKLTARISLDHNQAALCYDLTVDWHEISTNDRLVPQICFTAPANYAVKDYAYDVPGGVLRRAAIGLDVPANSFGAALNADGPGLLLTSDCKYGFRAMEDTIGLTLIHAPSSPDPYPERGIHHIRMALGACCGCEKGMSDYAYDINHLPSYITRRPAKGSMPARAENLKLDSESVIITGVKIAEDGSGLVIRMNEVSGKPGEAVITLPKTVKTAHFADSLERAADGSCDGIALDGNTLSIQLTAHAMRAILVTF